jgi:hypothetical protein
MMGVAQPAFQQGSRQTRISSGKLTRRKITRVANNQIRGNREEISQRVFFPCAPALLLRFSDHQIAGSPDSHACQSAFISRKSAATLVAAPSLYVPSRHAPEVQAGNASV